MAGELLDEKYGKAGTESRIAFHKESITWCCWKQRFQNYGKAFGRMSRAIEVVKVILDDDLCNLAW